MTRDRAARVLRAGGRRARPARGWGRTRRRSRARRAGSSWRATCERTKPAALVRPAQRLRALRLVAEDAEEDARVAQVGRDLHAGDGDQADARILDLAQQELGDQLLQRLGDAVGPPTRLVRASSAPSQAVSPRGRSGRASAVEDLDLLLADLGDVQVLDEAHHLAQRAVDVARRRCRPGRRRARCAARGRGRRIPQSRH